MQCFIIFAFVLGTAGIVIALGFSGASRSSRLSNAYEALANSFAGTVHRTGWFSHPRVSFRHRGANVLVGVFPYGINPGDRGPVTQMQIEWQDAHLRCHIVHPPRPARLSVGDGLHTWTTRNSQFDQRYSIRTSDPAATNTLITKVVQLLIERLRQSPRPGPLLLEVQRGVFRISKVLAIYRPDELKDFVNTGLELYDQALLASSVGIEFMEAESAQPLEQVLCSVCGEEITKDLVFCRSCKTPHHRDCWLYAGRCSVFGCGETQFHIPQRARRIPNR